MKFNAEKPFSSTSYGRLARFYDAMDWLNYGRAAQRSRNCFLAELPRTIRSPLVVACGTGHFALSLVRELGPPSLCVNDISRPMLDLTVSRIHSLDWQGNLEKLGCDITTLERPAAFDFISLNYILGIFPIVIRIEFIKKVARLLAPGGIIQVADFHRPRGLLKRLFFYVNYGMALILFWLTSGNKPNTLGDLERQFSQAGLEVVKKKTFVWELYATYLLRVLGSERVIMPPI